MLTLYYSPGACSLGPHILMEETGIACEYRRVAIADGENKSKSYYAINPRGQLPALSIDGRIATEGPAIMNYLSSLTPDLLPPKGSFELAKCYEWIAWCSSSLHISYAQFWRPERFLAEDAQKDQFIQSGKELITRKNQEVEAAMAGPWILGARYSPADCYLLAFYRWGVRIGLPMNDACPLWTAWKDRMISRPAVLRVLEAEGIGTDWCPA